MFICKVWGYLLQGSLHPQNPSRNTSNQLWWQLSAWVLSVRIRSWQTGECLKKKTIYCWLSPRVVPSLQCLLASGCSPVPSMFLKYFVQNLYLLLVGMLFLIQAIQSLLKARTLTRKEKNDEVSLVLLYNKIDDNDTAIKTLWHLCKSV